MRIDRTVAAAIQEAMRQEYDALSRFRPLRSDNPMNSQEEFIKCKATQILLSGSNQSGKTLLNCVHTAAFVLDRPVTLLSGEQVHVRKRIHRNRPVLVWQIGLQLNHIGDTLYPKLFMPGAFRLIRDPETKRIRAWNPAYEYDRAYEEKSVEAPPLIPETEFDGKPAFYVKASHQIECVTLKNGSIMRFYASTADVKQGDQVHLLKIDEEIDEPRHYNEWLQRIGPVKGQLVWSAWPGVDPNEAMVRLYELCELDVGKPRPRAVRFQLLQRDNPYYPKEMREELESTGQMDDDEARARIDGLFVLDKRRMFPQFSRRLHSLLPYDPAQDDKLAEVCRDTGQVPASWTRYLGLDPGTEHPAVVLAAVPPPKEFGDFIVVYREIYPGRADADQLAELVEAETKGQSFEAFVIDLRAGQQTAMGYGISVCDNYRRAFQKRGLASRRSGSGFLWGNDDPSARAMQIQGLLNDRYGDRPKLRIWLDRCPNLVKQMETYRKEIEPRTKRVLDRPARRQQVDCVDALGYIVALEPVYREPEWLRMDISRQLTNDLRALLRLPEERRPISIGPGGAYVS